ncbi:MAG: sulfatase [Armatimonadota bacterium]|nr:MAG: sulfatase [Armatimonadota bacterium]
MNCIYVVLDTMRPDHIGAYGNEWIHTPNLDAFAQDAALFTAAYPESLPTLPFRRGLYTGARVFPFADHRAYKGDFVGAPGWGPMREERHTISEILNATGYRTGLISDVYHQFKPSKNYARGFDQWTWIRGQESDKYRSGPPPAPELIEKHLPEGESDRPLEQRRGYRLMRQYLMNVAERRCEEDFFAPQVFRAASAWLEQNRDAERLFLTVESFDPHEPWDPPDYYRRLYDSSGDEVRNVALSPYGPSHPLTEAELKRLRANYAGEVTMVDRWFGCLLDTIERLGLTENTIIVVVSDHGHCLGERGLVSKQGHPMSREIADLVLLIRGPGIKARRSDALVMSHDIPVTMLRLLGLEPADTMSGLDFSALLRGDENSHRDHTTTAWGPFVMVREGKYWYNAFLGREAERLYDFEADPGLTRNVAGEHDDVCQSMADLAVADAGEPIPEWLLGMRNQPGCTPLEPELAVE